VKSEFLCLAHALIFAMGGKSVAQVQIIWKWLWYEADCSRFLTASGLDLINGGGFNEIEQIQNYLCDYKVVRMMA